MTPVYGRIELRIGVSKAKNGKESDFELRFPVSPPKLDKNSEKRFPRPKKFTPIFFPTSKNEMLGIV